jgi:hypothetical protein
MKDTNCASLECRSASRQDACAMISCSCGHCVKSLQLSIVAERSSPMMGTHRSNLSCRTLLFLLVLLGMPMAVRADALEDSARELADKIAAALPTKSDMSLGVRNSSGLTADDVGRITQALEAELRKQGIRIQTTGFVGAQVAITLSDSIENLVWTAGIHMPDLDKVVLIKVSRPLTNRLVSDAIPIMIYSEKFWEGPERVLDAMVVKSSNGDSLLLLLTPVSLVIRKVGNDEVSVVQIPATEPIARDPAGGMNQSENKVMVRFPKQICSIDLDTRRLTECHPPASFVPSGSVFESLKFAVLGPLPEGFSGQIAQVEITCRTGPVYVLSGSGDYSKPDNVRVFESTVSNGIVTQNPLSDFLHFAGPVMALIPNGTTPRAIVRNLETGNYEAYGFSITCAH